MQDHGTCFNGEADTDEEGVDCGGSCDLECDNCLACTHDCTGNCVQRGEESASVDECGICDGDSSSCSGCLVVSACNYNPDAIVHDASLCIFASASEDCFGGCVVDLDCAGNCGGDSTIDVCGVCEGDNSTCTGCSDDENACNYQQSDFIQIQECYYPKSDNHDCFGKCIAEYDCCNVCGGNGSSCECTSPVPTTTTLRITREATQEPSVTVSLGHNDGSCSGYCGHRAPSGCYCDDTCAAYGDCCSDQYRVCIDTTTTATTTTGETTSKLTTEYQCSDGFDCEGVCGGSAVIDSCSVCNGFGSSCFEKKDCRGVRGGSAVYDECGICHGFGASCSETDYCVGGTIDCAGECDGTRALDECGVCAGDGSTCCDTDCFGVCGGSATEDSCDVCGGFGSTCASSFCANGTVDCAGECDGNMEVDSCDVCGGSGTSCQDGLCGFGTIDCTGTCNGTVIFDECGVCGGFGASCADNYCSDGEIDCFGACDEGAVTDECGVCDGDGTTCCEELDCNGVCGGSDIVDECAVCGGYGATCTSDYCAAGTLDCNGECDGSRQVDECDVCGGDGTSCVYCSDGSIDCAGECDGSHVEDECGICNGDGTTCVAGFCDEGLVDCRGECNGLALEDECGICNGNGATCAIGGFCNDGVVDCAGDCDGRLRLDICDICGGDNSTCPEYSSCSTVPKCNGRAPSGCYCDDSCHNYGDCCQDIKDYCIFRPPPSPSPAPGVSNEYEFQWTLSTPRAFVIAGSKSSWAVGSNNSAPPAWEGESAFVAFPGDSAFTETVSVLPNALHREAVVDTALFSDKTISLLLRTPTVYPDNRFCNALIWTTGPGTATVDVSIELLIKVGGELISQVYSCGTVSTERGIECEFQLDEQIFAETSEDIFVQAFIDGTNYTSDIAWLSLEAPLETPTELFDDSYVALQLPSYPVVEQGSFETTLLATTVDTQIGSFELGTWVVQITTTTLDDEETSAINIEAIVSDFYDISHHTLSTAVTLVGTMKSDVTNTTLLSSRSYEDGSLSLATITWKLHPNATNAAFDSVFVDDLVSTASKKVVDDEDGFMVLAGEVTSSSADITVEQSTFVGLQIEVGAASTHELVNLAVLGYDTTEEELDVYVVSKCHPSSIAGGCQEEFTRTAASSVDGTLSCSSGNTKALDVRTAAVGSSCFLSMSGDETEGGDVVVKASIGDSSKTAFSQQVLIRVWFPVDLRVDVDDSVLDAVLPSSGETTTSTVFQSTTFAVTAKLAVGYDYFTPRVDLSGFVVVQSADTTIVSVNGTNIHGLKTGSTAIRCTSCSIDGATAKVSVSNTDSVSMQLIPIVFTDIAHFNVTDLESQNEGRGLDGLDENKPFWVARSDTQFVQEFSAEGDSGYIFVYAQYSDGHSFLLDTNANLRLSVRPGRVNLTVDNTSTALYRLVVPVGAGDQSGKFGTIAYEIDGVVWAEEDIFISIELAPIDFVKITTSEPLIYPQLDTMAKAPFKLAHLAVMTTTVVFKDGSRQDFSTDARSSYSSSSDVLTETSKGTFAVAVEKTHEDAVQEAVTITVSINGFSATVEIAVDVAQSMSVVPYLSPQCELSGCTDKRLLYKVAGSSGTYQHVRLSAFVETALGSSYEVPFDLTTTKIDISTLEVFGGSCAVSGRELLSELTTPGSSLQITTGSDTTEQAPAPSPFEQACEYMSNSDCCDTNGDLGRYDISFGSTSALTSTIVVTFREFYVEVTLRRKAGFVSIDDVVILSPNRTISTSEKISADVMLSDNTVVNSADLTYAIADFLSFATSDTNVITVDDDGTITPVANSIAGVYTNYSVANSLGVVFDWTAVFVNLDPSVGDVDVGSPNGFQFQDFVSSSISDEIEVPIRFNSGSVPLTGFQVQLFFDSSVIEAVSVKNGADWSQSVVGTLASPSTMVQVLSSSPASTLVGSSIEIAVVTFKVVGEGATLLQGVVVESLTSNGVHIGEDGRDIVAGAGTVVVGPSTRRNLGANPTKTLMQMRPQLSPRRVLSSCVETWSSSCLRGDTNGDCTFSLSDLDFLIRYKTGENVEFKNEDYQKRMMDADLDGDVDAVDISFLLYSLAKKYLFLQHIPTVTIDSCSLNVSLTLCNDNSDMVEISNDVSVLVEIGSKDTDSFGIASINSGTFVDFSEDGVVIAANDSMRTTSNVSFGVSVKMEPTNVNYNLGVVVLVETLADNGVVDVQRKFPWRGSSHGYFGEVGFDFDPIVSLEYGCSCDAQCQDNGFFKAGCLPNGSDTADSTCTKCFSDISTVYPLSNGGTADSCTFAPCPAGYRCNFDNTTNPVPCSAGTFQDEEGASKCKSCSPGYFQPEAGQSACVQCADDCDAGYYTGECNGTSAGVCQKCTPKVGYKFTGSGGWNDNCTMEAEPTDCPTGQYKATEDFFNYTCVDCDPVLDGWYYSDQGGFYHICPTEPCFVGCGIGYYSDGCGGTSAGVCVPCKNVTNGTYFVGDGDLSHECITRDCAVEDCDVGYFLSGCAGASAGECAECTEPTDGYFVSSGGLEDACGIEQCTDCPVGEYLDGCGGTSAGVCKACSRDDGFYIVEADSLREDVCEMEACATDCDIGYYRSGCEGTNQGSCVPCSDPTPGYVIVGDGGLEDACDEVACAANCPVGFYNDDCGNIENPDGRCVPCSLPPPGYYFIGDGNTDDSCSIAACDWSQCGPSEYLANCNGTSAGECVSCTTVELGQYWIESGGDRDACEVETCSAECEIGFFLAGCEGGTTPGECVPCTNAPFGSVYQSDGGMSNSCDFVECDPICPNGEFVENCTENDTMCATCTNVGSTVCMRNGANNGHEFNYAPGSSHREIALRACESEYGGGNCEYGVCGGYEYFYKFADGHCRCDKAVGTVEWVFNNKFGYVAVDQDYRQYSSQSVDDVSAANLFTRMRTASGCDDSVQSWELLDIDLGFPNELENATASHDCGSYYYSDDGGFADECPTALCNTNCEAHQYNAGCGGASSGNCTNCSSIPPGYHYYKDGNLVDDCLSKLCVDNCDNGYYLADCYIGPGTCKECSSPPDGYYLTSNGNQTDNCSAAPCLSSCPEGYFLGGECGGRDGASNYECTPCISCFVGLTTTISCDGTTFEDITECKSPTYERVALGENNYFSFANSSIIVFGANNSAHGNSLFIGDGKSNYLESYVDLTGASGGASSIAGGSNLIVSGASSSMLGGTYSCLGSDRSVLVGGHFNDVGCGDGFAGADAILVGGLDNLNHGLSTFVGSGDRVKVTERAEYTSIGGGQRNSAGNDWAAIIGGKNAKAVSNYATAIGGYGCKANGRFSTVLGGARNTANGKYSTSGGYSSRASATRSFVMGLDSSKYCRSVGINSVNVCVKKGFFINGMDLAAMVAEINSGRRLGTEDFLAHVSSTKEQAMMHQDLIALKKQQLSQLRHKLQRLKHLNRVHR